MHSSEMMNLATRKLERMEPQKFQSSMDSQKKFLCSDCGCERHMVPSSVPEEWRLCESCCIQKFLKESKEEVGIIPAKVGDFLTRMEFPPKLLSCNHDLPSKFNSIDSDGGIFLYGPTGTGKTTTLYLILRDKLRRGFLQAIGKPRKYEPPKITFVNVPSLMLRLQSMFKKNLDPNEAIIELAESSFLILDDLGAEKQTDWVRQTLYVLINEREMYCRKTWITSNKSLEELSREIDPRIASRIAGMCAGQIIHMSGDDMRIKRL